MMKEQIIGFLSAFSLLDEEPEEKVMEKFGDLDFLPYLCNRNSQWYLGRAVR